MAGDELVNEIRLNVDISLSVGGKNAFESQYSLVRRLFSSKIRCTGTSLSAQNTNITQIIFFH